MNGDGEGEGLTFTLKHTLRHQALTTHSISCITADAPTSTICVGTQGGVCVVFRSDSRRPLSHFDVSSKLPPLRNADDHSNFIQSIHVVRQDEGECHLMVVQTKGGWMVAYDFSLLSSPSPSPSAPSFSPIAVVNLGSFGFFPLLFVGDYMLSANSDGDGVVTWRMDVRKGIDGAAVDFRRAAEEGGSKEKMLKMIEKEEKKKTSKVRIVEGDDVDSEGEDVPKGLLMFGCCVENGGSPLVVIAHEGGQIDISSFGADGLRRVLLSADINNMKTSASVPHLTVVTATCVAMADGRLLIAIGGSTAFVTFLVVAPSPSSSSSSLSLRVLKAHTFEIPHAGVNSLSIRAVEDHQDHFLCVVLIGGWDHRGRVMALEVVYPTDVDDGVRIVFTPLSVLKFHRSSLNRCEFVDVGPKVLIMTAASGESDGIVGLWEAEESHSVRAASRRKQIEGGWMRKVKQIAADEQLKLEGKQLPLLEGKG